MFPRCSICNECLIPSGESQHYCEKCGLIYPNGDTSERKVLGERYNTVKESFRDYEQYKKFHTVSEEENHEIESLYYECTSMYHELYFYVSDRRSTKIDERTGKEWRVIHIEKINQFIKMSEKISGKINKCIH